MTDDEIEERSSGGISMAILIAVVVGLVGVTVWGLLAVMAGAVLGYLLVLRQQLRGSI
jgi:hypothetical protein